MLSRAYRCLPLRSRGGAQALANSYRGLFLWCRWGGGVWAASGQDQSEVVGVFFVNLLLLVSFKLR